MIEVEALDVPRSVSKTAYYGVEDLRRYWISKPIRTWVNIVQAAPSSPPPGLVHARMLEAARPSACRMLRPRPEDASGGYSESDLADLLCESV